MAEKLDPYRSYGQKLISLFARLLFSGESHSLIELSRLLDCSKQTVLRLVEDIRRSYGVEVEESFVGRKKYYRIRKQSGGVPVADLTGNEMAVLQICRAFTEHLIGRKLFEDAAIAIGKSRRMLKDQQAPASNHFASIIPGTIDYTPHHHTILSLVNAMDERCICEIAYRNPNALKALTLYIKPFKLFSRRETIYLHAAMARKPGRKYRKQQFNPLLAVHRIVNVRITDRNFEKPGDYDFERDFNKTFGVMKDESFTVEAEFSTSAAGFVSERSWSPGQRITKVKGGGIKLVFTASSEPEILSWILSFGDSAKLIKPAKLKKQIKQKIRLMRNTYWPD